MERIFAAACSKTRRASGLTLRGVKSLGDWIICRYDGKGFSYLSSEGGRVWSRTGVRPQECYLVFFFGGFLVSFFLSIPLDMTFLLVSNYATNEAAAEHSFDLCLRRTSGGREAPGFSGLLLQQIQKSLRRAMKMLLPAVNNPDRTE